MKILMESNPVTMGFIGVPLLFEKEEYRFMKYCLSIKTTSGDILYNCLTGAAVLLDKSEVNDINNINEYEFLYRNYFLVKKDFNEKEIVESFRSKNILPVDSLYLEHPSTYTIMTTTRCNARCSYCYELHQKGKTHMSLETAIKVAKYINEVSLNNIPIKLAWFGGEPLFNKEVIDIIVNYLRNENRQYYSTMISNGYLLNNEVISQAVNIWNLQEVQITIDGTEKIYNKIKNYIYKDNVNPYKKVLNNIALLLNNNIRVDIRLNVNIDNANDIINVIHELVERFNKHPRLGIYAWPIFEDANNIRTEEERVILFNYIDRIEKLLINYGYKCLTPLNNNIGLYQCMADDGDSVVISPRGELGVCEHYTDRHFYSNIENPSLKNIDELKSWKEHNDLDICKDCPIYPKCVLPKLCTEMGKCDEHYKKWRISKVIRGIKDYFRDFEYLPKILNVNEI